MSLENALPPEQYSAYHPGVFATPVPVVRKPELPCIEYILSDSDNGKVNIEIVVQVEYDVRRYRGESGKWEYEFALIPMVRSISSVKQWLCGVEIPLAWRSVEEKWINAANQWLNNKCVDDDLRDKILQHVRV